MSGKKKSETRKSRKARTAPYQHLYDTFLRRLIAAREAAGLSQQEVSERMGMARSFLSKCETGERSIDVMELIQLATIYGKEPQYFLSAE